MKRIFMVWVVIGCVGAAQGATKCVALDATVSPSSYNYTDYKSDWTVTYADGTVLKGVGVCSDQKSTYAGASAAITLGTNTGCWCKMVIPAVSRWVYYGAEGRCVDKCGYNCAYSVRNNSSFRAAMFGSIQ